MLSQVSGNQSEDNEVKDIDDDIPLLTPPTIPSKQQPQGRPRRQQRRPPCGTTSHR